jgi:hypothetical protein
MKRILKFIIICLTLLSFSACDTAPPSFENQTSEITESSHISEAITPVFSEQPASPITVSSTESSVSETELVEITTSPVETTISVTETTTAVVYPVGLLMSGDVVSSNDVDITYNGKGTDQFGISCFTYTVKNNSDKGVIIMVNYIATKKDGTEVDLGMTALVGDNLELYNKDLEENGWAVMEQTSYVPPNSSMNLTSQGFKLFEAFGGSMDVDNDGYVELYFTLNFQNNADTLIFSTNPPKTDTYVIPY